MSQMRCEHAHQYLQLYVDGRLSGRYQAALAQHLAGCGACRHELRMLRLVTVVASDALASVAPPAQLHATIMARVAAHEARRARIKGFAWRWADAAVAAALATVATVLLILGNPMLRAAFPAALAQAFPFITLLFTARGPGSIAWVAWLAWVAAGMTLAFLFAGGEVRAHWRHIIGQRMALVTQHRLP